jgi:hypothetical protein
MDTNKLSSLLGRLEEYVSNAENSAAQNPDQLVAKLESLLNRLENANVGNSQVVAKAQAIVASSAPVASSPGTGGNGAFLTIFNEKCFKNVQALLDCTKNDIKNEQLVEGVNLYIEMLKSQEAVLKTMGTCKKPSDI